MKVPADLIENVSDNSLYRTIGLIIDEAGDDVYDAPDLSLGAGNANGMGIFLDKAGNDTYRAKTDFSLGRSRISGDLGLRRQMLCLGLFVDTGGDDTYPGTTTAGNGRGWTNPGKTDPPLEKEVGAGIDEP